MTTYYRSAYMTVLITGTLVYYGVHMCFGPGRPRQRLDASCITVHAGLRRAGIPLPSIDLGCAHDVTLSVAWGGAIIMESWRLICDAAGCLEEYTSTLAASVNAVHYYMHRHSPATLMHQLAGNAPWPAMPDSSDPHAAVEVTIAMRNDGYIGRRG